MNVKFRDILILNNGDKCFEVLWFLMNGFGKKVLKNMYFLSKKSPIACIRKAGKRMFLFRAYLGVDLKFCCHITQVKLFLI